MSEPTFPLEQLSVRAWDDPLIEQVGHDPRSTYVERFWLGVLGPSATWLLRRFADGLEAQPEGFELDLPTTARSLGLGVRGGKHSPFMRSITRCCQFGLARHFDERTLVVRRAVPPLSARQLERLPDALQVEHGSWATGPAGGGRERRDHARRMALTLLEVGESPAAAEVQLHRWQVHPALAHEAVGWAVAARRSRDAHPSMPEQPTAEPAVAPAPGAPPPSTRRIPPPPTFVARP